MAEYAYLQTAAGQLRQAVIALKNEASMIRTNADKQRRQAESEFTKLEARITADRAALQGFRDSPERVTALETEARKTSADVATKRKDLDTQLQQAEQRARDKESASTELDSLAASLERFSGDPRLR